MTSMAVGAPIRTALLLSRVILTDLTVTGSHITATTIITMTQRIATNAGPK